MEIVDIMNKIMDLSNLNETFGEESKFLREQLDFLKNTLKSAKRNNYQLSDHTIVMINGYIEEGTVLLEKVSKQSWIMKSIKTFFSGNELDKLKDLA